MKKIRSSVLFRIIRTIMLSACTSVINLVYRYGRIRNDLVYIQSRDGLDFAGNMLRISLELQKPEYQPKKIILYVADHRKKMVCDMVKQYALSNVRVITNKLVAACCCEIAGFLLSDSTLNYSYTKKDGQIVVNTWHGTPLKHMAKDSPTGRRHVGGGQRAQLMADYLVYPSRWMKETMQRAYMIDNYFEGINLYCGYPRNSVFFSAPIRERMRDMLGLKDKQVFAYLPTFRGTISDVQDAEQTAIVRDALLQLDSKLRDDQIMLVKLHTFTQKKINMDGFSHIKPWPACYETYEVLCATDCLITDYSSVLFDYANTGHKIILFAYDREDYLRNRGIYMPLEELPFPLVETTDALLREMNLPKQYDDTAFRRQFDTFDCEDATQKLCRRVFLGQKTCLEERSCNHKKRVLIFGGSLDKNGITTALTALLGALNCDEYQFAVSFRQWQIAKRPDRLSAIPDGFDYLPIFSQVRGSIGEKLVWLWYRHNQQARLPRPLKRMFRREWQRCYTNVHFDWVIDFDGYGIETMLFLKAAPCKAMTWVHSDMVQELRNRSSQHKGCFRYAYGASEVTAVVSPDLAASIQTITGGAGLHLAVIPNLFDEESTIKKGSCPVSPDQDTQIWSGCAQGLEGVLSAPGKKFITVGRFSPEKAHLRLLDAFERFCQEAPDSQLIIIGGNSIPGLYEKTLQKAKNSPYSANITIIKSISNPMPIIRRCDLFIFCSLYEGPSRAILEADCLGLPVIATDGVGVHPMMQQYGGYLIENSTDGLVQGMRDYMAGKVPGKLSVNHAQNNHQALQAFMAALDRPANAALDKERV